MVSRSASTIGNRIVLIGAIVYLLEWVVIPLAGDTGPADPGTKSPDALLSLYSQHPLQQAFLVTWLSVVLLGRIAIPVGIKAALRDSGRSYALCDVAIGAMAVSVVLELASQAVVGAASYLANRGASATTIVTLDALAGWTLGMMFAPLGVSVALSAWCIFRSRLLPAWTSWIGLVAGVGLIVGGVVGGPAYSESATAKTAFMVTMVSVPLFWAWMLITGVYLFRRTPKVSAPVTPT